MNNTTSFSTSHFISPDTGHSQDDMGIPILPQGTKRSVPPSLELAEHTDQSNPIVSQDLNALIEILKNHYSELRQELKDALNQAFITDSPLVLDGFGAVSDGLNGVLEVLDYYTLQGEPLTLLREAVESNPNETPVYEYILTEAVFQTIANMRLLDIPNDTENTIPARWIATRDQQQALDYPLSVDELDTFPQCQDSCRT